MNCNKFDWIPTLKCLQKLELGPCTIDVNLTEKLIITITYLSLLYFFHINVYVISHHVIFTFN